MQISMTSGKNVRISKTPSSKKHSAAEAAAAQVVEWKQALDSESSTLAQPAVGCRRAIPENLLAPLHVALHDPLRRHRPDLALWCRPDERDEVWMPSLMIFEYVVFE